MEILLFQFVLQKLKIVMPFHAFYTWCSKQETTWTEELRLEMLLDLGCRHWNHWPIPKRTNLEWHLCITWQW